MLRISLILPIVALTAIATAAYSQTTPAVLTPGTPIAIAGPSGSFDYMTVDASTRRVFASHPGAKSLVVFDIRKNEVKQIDLQTEVNGVAIDPNDNKFFTAGGGAKVFDFNRKTLKQQGEIDLDGPGDSICFVPDNDTLYIDNDDGTKIWAVDGKTDKLTATIAIAGAPEYMAYSPSAKQLYQNIKTTDQIQVIDTTTNTVIATWATTPATKPHGLVYDPVSNRLFSAGKNNTLAVIDAASGKVLSSIPLASATDQIAFDSKLRRIYAPGGGFITVVGVSNDGTATVMGQVAVNAKAHTLAVDPNTNTVWISYPDGDTCYLQPLTPAATN
jgi:DNA-binding beta-propeller fold protein YncE